MSDEGIPKGLTPLEINLEEDDIDAYVDSIVNAPTDDVVGYSNDWGASEDEYRSYGWTVEYANDSEEGFSRKA